METLSFGAEQYFALRGAADEAEFLTREIRKACCYERHPLRPLAEGAVVVDVGANIGVFSLHCARDLGLQRLNLVAIEPIHEIYDVLAANLAPDRLPVGARVRLLRTAVGYRRMTDAFLYYPEMPGESTRYGEERSDQRKRLTLAAEKTASAIAERRSRADGRSKRRRCDESEFALPVECEAVLTDFLQCMRNDGARETSLLRRCPVTTISDIMVSEGLEKIDLLKIDVEGDELEVLRGIGAADWPKISQLAIEVHDVDGRLHATVQLLKDLGFAVRAELQTASVDGDGFFVFTPAELGLYLVYATRGCGAAA
jgi:FkbM family methyltransferase